MWLASLGSVQALLGQAKDELGSAGLDFVAAAVAEAASAFVVEQGLA